MKNRFRLVRQWRSLYFVFTLCTVFLLASCSSTPSEALAVDFINKIGANDNLFKVKSLKKTNGIAEGKQYIMEYEFEIECLSSNTDNQFFSPGMIGQIACNGAGEAQKGKGWLAFEKTENGWQVDSSGSSTWRSPRGSLSLP